ncbi:hypothetical protein ACFUIY_19400 [Streptomyces griseorubiginosus]|uniref:hypothetical protein n=1 Tax=Streptomyces griseorubiginosus TaxID=67304 RepID=UPI003630E5B1
MAIVSLPNTMRLDTKRVCILCGKPVSLADASMGLDEMAYHSDHLNNPRELIAQWAGYRVEQVLAELYEDMDNE